MLKLKNDETVIYVQNLLHVVRVQEIYLCVYTR